MKRISTLIIALSMGVAAQAQLIDDFSGDLSAYTSTVILDANGGGANTSAWQITSGALELDTTTFDGIEQYAFIRGGLSLSVGDEIQVNLTHNGASQDLGLYVGGTTPATGVRQDYIAMYARADGNLYSRGFDGTTEYGLVGSGVQAYDTLFIARTDVNTFEAGFYDGATRNVTATRTPTTANEADVVGFYADVRAVGTLGSLDNLTLAQVPEPSTFALIGLAGMAGMFWMRRRK